jgi:rhamnulokinase
VKESLYLAVDLGAGSGRVFLAGIAPEEFLLEEVRRFHYPPSRSEGHLRWDVPYILGEIKAGAREAGERANKLHRYIRSIGIDAWGVDYGLIGAQGILIENPVCYRDDRTKGTMVEVLAQVPREEIYERTGIQFLPFNTLFQLYARKQRSIRDSPVRLLLIPDLMNFFLTGKAAAEYTNATTTQMVNARTGTWDREMLARLSLPANLLPEIVPAGTDLGLLKPELARELCLDGVRVVAPATHDTGSAVAGTPLEEGWAYISSGTWSLVGVERPAPLINRDVARHNFTNEGGAHGTIRFLKNVMGLWLLESCRREWKEQGTDVDHERLHAEVSALESWPGFIFPDDERFFNPPSMLEAVAEQLAQNGYPVCAVPCKVAKVILDSLAFRYASVLRSIEVFTNQKIAGVQIIGGGSQNDYLNQATANATGLPVLAGPAEATVTGNVVVQAIATGRFASLSDARRYIARHVRLKSFKPCPSPGWEEAARSYAAIEARYLAS